MKLESIDEIISGVVGVSGDKVKVLKGKKLESVLMDELVWKAVFGSNEEKAVARFVIWEIAQQVGVIPVSIHDLYIARGKGKVDADFSVPAMNLRGMAYDTARAVFSQVKKLKVGAFILEIARSEMEYTGQEPEEYAIVMLAAALREGYRGPVFIQGDHFQTKMSNIPGKPKAGEIVVLKKLIGKAIKAGFYNIDIDTSTLVDLTREKEGDQQKSNIRHCLIFSEYVRSLQPKGVVVSLGGEIGHIGGKNSTVLDFEAFMDGFISGKPKGMVGLSKISVQAGTSHGGVVLADGSIADTDVDFRTLKEISDVGREKYGISGAVQHGASTLAGEFFSKFAESGVAEVHLATGFQNLIMDHSQFPGKLLGEMYEWLDEEKVDERKGNWTDEQFHYKLRKKAWGRFKKECWSIDRKRRIAIRKSLGKKFEFLFRALNVVDTRKMVDKFVKPVVIHKSLGDFNIENKES